MIGFNMIKNKKEILSKVNLGKRSIILIAVFLGIIIILIGCFVFLYEKKCNTEACFKKEFNTCKKAVLFREDNDAIWIYRILSKDSDSSCKIEVSLVRIKDGRAENEILNGKKMICSVFGFNALSPESDLSRCSGELKEKMQELMIQKMHDYLITNCGKINSEFNNIP